jgi:hypothetical protein
LPFVRPDLAAFRELEVLVRHLSDQLAGYRRRALVAEARVRDLEQRTRQLEAALTEARAPAGPVAGRVTGEAGLEAENHRLRQRLTEAREKTGALVERIRFVRQAAAQGTGAGGER